MMTLQESSSIKVTVKGQPDAVRHWLNSCTAPGYKGATVATWHRFGDYDLSCSDIFLWKDHGREGSNTDYPLWEELVDLVGEEFAGSIWIQFESDAV